jgi:hypothetical protein
VYGMHEVRLEDVLRVIFDHLEPVWLARIWFGGWRSLQRYDRHDLRDVSRAGA